MNFLRQRLAYWLSLSMLPSFAVGSVFMFMFCKPEPGKIVEPPVILVECDGTATILWTKEDHPNVHALIERVSGEVASALFANARENDADVSIASAKLQGVSKYFLPGSDGEKVFLSQAREARLRVKAEESAFRFDTMPGKSEPQGPGKCSFRPRFADVTYDIEEGDWAAVVRGIQIKTLENGTQESKHITLEILFKLSKGRQRSAKGQPVLIYNMRVTYDR